MNAEETKAILEQLKAMGIESYQELMPLVAEYIHMQGVANIVVGAIAVPWIGFSAYKASAIYADMDGELSSFMFWVLNILLTIPTTSLFVHNLPALFCPEGAAIMRILGL